MGSAPFYEVAVFLDPYSNTRRDRWHGATKMIHRIKPSRFFRVGACPAIIAKRHNRPICVSPNKRKFSSSHSLWFDLSIVAILCRDAKPDPLGISSSYSVTPHTYFEALLERIAYGKSPYRAAF